MKKTFLFAGVLLLASGIALAKPHRGASNPITKKAAVSSASDAGVADVGESFSASIEIADEEVHILLPSDLHEKVIREKWDVLALVYRNEDRPPYKSAYLLQDTGDYYLLKMPYPRQKAWTLEIILAPPKGQSLESEFQFFDRNHVQ